MLELLSVQTYGVAARANPAGIQTVEIYAAHDLQLDVDIKFVARSSDDVIRRSP